MRRNVKKPRWLVPGGLALVLLTVGILALCGVFSLTPEVSPPSSALLTASDGLDAVHIDASLDVEAAALTVVQSLTLTNRTGQVLDASILRAWPNAFQSPDTSPCAAEASLYAACYVNGFSAGSLVISQVLSNGEPVAHRYVDDARTVLSVPVSGGWQPDATIILQLSYTVHIPQIAYRFGANDGIWALGNTFIQPAVWQNGAFRTDAYAPVGDPFLSDCMNYTLTLAVPEGYTCTGSGWPEVEALNGRSIYRFSALAVRDFALVVSDRFQLAHQTVDGVLVAAYTVDVAQAREMLSYARKALVSYNARYGAYPYPSLTLVQINFPMGGMEYPAMAMIANDQLRIGGQTLETVIAHEVAHQWWYAVVGSDPWEQAWQDEALCEFSVLEYLEDVHGRATRNEREQTVIEPALRVTVPRGVTPGAPLDRFSTMAQYSLVVYNRGAALFLALDRTISDGLDPFLRAYYQRFAFTRATREDFESLLAEFTGEDLTPLMRDYLDTYILN